MHRLVKILFALAIVCGFPSPPASAEEKGLTVFAAASMKNALDDVDAAYMAKTQTALDLVALVTLWLVVVPPSDFGTSHDADNIALTIRLALSGLYGIDMTIRAVLAKPAPGLPKAPPKKGSRS